MHVPCHPPVPASAGLHLSTVPLEGNPCSFTLSSSALCEVDVQVPPAGMPETRYTTNKSAISLSCAFTLRFFSLLCALFLASDETGVNITKPFPLLLPLPISHAPYLDLSFCSERESDYTYSAHVNPQNCSRWYVLSRSMSMEIVEMCKGVAYSVPKLSTRGDFTPEFRCV